MPGAILVFSVLVLSGCTLVMPTRHLDESTPIDRGLQGAYLSTAVVLPFDARGSEAWGMYASRQLADFLRENGAFRRVSVAGEGDAEPGFIIQGTFDHLAYGGNDEPTTVFLTVKVISASDSQVRFQRSTKASSSKSAFHLAWLRRVDVPSPYIEDVLAGLLKAIASDIAARAHSPAVQNP